MAMTAREQLERFLRVTFLVFILAAAGFLSALTTVRIAIRGRMVSMPNITGKSLNEAQRMLGADHLLVRVVDRQYNTMPANAVLRQSPLPGEQVKISQDVQVILSLGPQKLTVPALEGRSMRAAHIALLEAGLPLGEVSTVVMPSADPGTVIKQEPPAGSTAVSPRVDLLVAGDEPAISYVMPSLVGLEQADAQRLLTANGLRIAKIDTVIDQSSPKGAVIEQMPARGMRITGDTAIEISVAQ
jgi:eukaryotic-like serine/threonine-protein kinase